MKVFKNFLNEDFLKLYKNNGYLINENLQKFEKYHAGYYDIL